MKTLLYLTLPLTALVISSHASPNYYHGKVGRLEAVFALNWGADDRVTGTYHYPSRKGVVYTLRGNNFSEGKLYLEEYTGRKLTAKCYLEKAVENGRIVWAGRMFNTDGREFNMFFSRGQGRAPAEGMVNENIGGRGVPYLGRIGGLEYKTNVVWGKEWGSTTVTFQNEVGRILEFNGINAPEGFLTLRLVSNDSGPTKQAMLRKRIEDGAVIWEGIFLADEGERLPITFGRGLERKIESLPPARKENLPRVKTANLLAETHWTEPPKRKTPVKFTPWPEAVVTSYGARVASTTYDGRKLSATFMLDDRPEDGSFDTKDFSVSVPSRKKVTLNVEYPDGENPFQFGDRCSVRFDKEGRICVIGVTAIAITHWRELTNGLIEVRGIKDSPAFHRDLERFPITTAEIDAARVLVFLPDKLALNRDVSEPLYWRGVNFLESQGLVIKTWGAGPGELSMGRISLDATEEIPWISVKDRSGSPSIPQTQKTLDAG